MKFFFLVSVHGAIFYFFLAALLGLCRFFSNFAVSLSVCTDISLCPGIAAIRLFG